MNEQTSSAAAAPLPLARIACCDLAFVLRFRAINDVRYYLNSFYAEPLEEGGCILVATDGHRLGVIKSSQSHVLEPVIVRTTPPLDNLIAGRNPAEELVLDDRKSAVRLMRHNVPTFIQPGDGAIDAKYVNWRKVFPPLDELVDGFPGAVNAQYLKGTIDAFAAMNVWPNGIYFQHKPEKDHFGVIVVRPIADVDMAALVMPIKYERKPLPEWLRQIPEPTPAPAPAIPA